MSRRRVVRGGGGGWSVGVRRGSGVVVAPRGGGGARHPTAVSVLLVQFQLPFYPEVTDEMPAGCQDGG